MQKPTTGPSSDTIQAASEMEDRDSGSELVSLVICTRNRGDQVLAALQTALDQDYPAFEVILVDQSDDTRTREAVAHFAQEPCFRYIHQKERGLSRARNLGLKSARGEMVAYTDDDCFVPKDWLRKLKAAFEKDPKIGIVFCNVQAADYDHAAGFIPAYVRQDEALLKTTSDKLRGRGIGAGMAVRKSIILALGGYDELLGTGGHFPSCEDGDMALRTILGGYYVLETHTTYVVHEGFRNWAQGKPLARHNWVGIGAAYAKPLRCGRWEALNVVLYEAFWVALVNSIRPIFRLKKPQGIRNFFFFWVGFFRGMAHPIEKSLILYR